MCRLNSDELLFFEKRPQSLSLYEAFLRLLLASFPAAKRKVDKTQITFSNRRVFACVSFLKVRKSSLLPPAYIVVTLGLPYPLACARVAAKTEPYPGRWTTHFLIDSEQQLDAEFLEWMAQAYYFSENK